MELALYCPDCGYYEREKDIIGKGGDYFTSVSAGRLFGELLAFQFAAWRDEAEQDWQIVEAGAHDGRLAADILAWLRHNRPGIFDTLEYWIIEPSANRREWQAQTLAEFGARVRWASTLTRPKGGDPTGDSLHPSGVDGVIFSNELLDALPVHRLAWDAEKREWFEWGVTLSFGKLAWQALPQDRPADCGLASTGEWVWARLGELPKELLEVLPNGFVLEVSPVAEQWYLAAAKILRNGKLVTIDYGLTTEEILVPERTHGTLRAYYKHAPSSDVLARPGMQDITAHVNFSALQVAGESSGLRTEAFSWQEQFLTGIATLQWNKNASGDDWTAERTRQFQTLTHPEQMGRKFRVLVQSRGQVDPT